MLVVTRVEGCFEEEDETDYASGLLKHTPFVVVFFFFFFIIESCSGGDGEGGMRLCFLGLGYVEFAY